MSATWISSLILGLPAVISVTSYKYKEATFSCTSDFERTTFSVYYSVVYTTFVFILPLILILTCNLKVSIRIIFRFILQSRLVPVLAEYSFLIATYKVADS